jgi:hypothetical protein
MSELDELKKSVEKLKQQLVATASKQALPNPAVKDLSAANLVDTFKGEPVGISVQEFFQQIDDAGEIANWSEDDKVRIVALKSKGAARRFLNSNPKLDRKNLKYDLLQREYIERFKQKQLPQYHYTALQTASQKKDESPEMFADRCRKLCENTIRQVSNPTEQKVIIEEAEHRLLAAYINGLYGMVGQQVRYRMPTTMAEAIQIATTVAAVNQHAQSQRNIFTIKCYNCKAEGHTSRTCTKPRPQSSQTRPNTHATNNRPVTCFKCNKPGHIARNCRSNPKAQSSALSTRVSN